MRRRPLLRHTEASSHAEPPRMGAGPLPRVERRPSAAKDDAQPVVCVHLCEIRPGGAEEQAHVVRCARRFRRPSGAMSRQPHQPRVALRRRCASPPLHPWQRSIAPSEREATRPSGVLRAMRNPSRIIAPVAFTPLPCSHPTRTNRTAPHLASAAAAAVNARLPPPTPHAPLSAASAAARRRAHPRDAAPPCRPRAA